MSIYKGFTYNEAGVTPQPWGATENQLDKDLIDTIVNDACLPQKETTNGHRHWRLYDPSGSEAIFMTGSYSYGYCKNALLVGTVPSDGYDPDGMINAIGSAYVIFGMSNTTGSDADGERASAIIARGAQSGGETRFIGQIKFAHDGVADDQKGRIVFYCNAGADDYAPTEVMRMTSAGDIYSAKYQSWAGVPSLDGAGTAPTYTTESYMYKRVGKLVYFQVDISANGTGTPGAGAGNLRINFPVAAKIDSLAAIGSGMVVNGTGQYVTLTPTSTNHFVFNTLAYSTLITGAGQDNATRRIMVWGVYEAA